MIAAAMGWIGTLGTISAYLMLSRGHWHAASLRYAAINGVGGLLGAAASAAYGAWPSAASNLIWSGVAVQSAVLELRRRQSERRRTERLAEVTHLPTVEDTQSLAVCAA